MQSTKPAYFDQFRCLAGACPDSCCKEWAVAVDEEAATRYRALPGELGRDLRAVMCQEDGDTVLALTEDGRCPMWRPDGLCRIQAQLGHEALCETCRQFPRLRHDYGFLLEQDLELSCPEAARLILSRDDSLLHTQLPGGSQPEFDPEALELLLRSRDEALALLLDCRYTVGEALAILLLYACRIQEQLDGGEEAVLEPDRELETARKIAGAGQLQPILDFFKELEILTPHWEARLASPEPGPWEDSFRAIGRYFLRRYWLQAVSDLDLMGRAKLTVISCLVIRALGGSVQETAQLYSKEIENNADNVDALLDGAYLEPALADRNLLGLLLEEKL